MSEPATHAARFVHRIEVSSHAHQIIHDRYDPILKAEFRGVKEWRRITARLRTKAVMRAGMPRRHPRNGG